MIRVIYHENRIKYNGDNSKTLYLNINYTCPHSSKSVSLFRLVFCITGYDKTALQKLPLRDQNTYTRTHVTLNSTPQRSAAMGDSTV